MSTTLSSVGKQVTIYCGTIVLIVGVIGDLLNILVFLSLRMFRQSSCAFYLTIMSIFNVCGLFFGLVPRISTALSGIDPSDASLVFCKSRLYLSQICIATSMTCWCLATIDQYVATCSRPRWQQFCNIKLAHRIIGSCIIFWILHGISYVVFRDHVPSPTTNKMICISTNYIFEQYRIYFILLGLYGFIPITITGIFGLMAFYNVQQMAYRTIPLVRRELEKQLTVIVLIQGIISIFTLFPYAIVTALQTNNNLTSDPIIQEKLQFAATVTLIIFYITFASPFYIYICSSERFRRQLIHVLFQIHFNRCQRLRIDTNQVGPET